MKPFAMIAAVVALGFAAWHYAAPEPQALVHLMYQTQTFPQTTRNLNKGRRRPVFTHHA